MHEQQGLTASQIAKTVALDRRTVAYWLTQATSARANPGCTLANSIRSNRRLCVCWNAISIRLKAELKKYTKPALLILDELGYLPIDKTGADLLFQVISLRYEQGALILTSNRAFKEWPTICNHGSTLTSAVLDRLLHHAATIIIEGKSFRMKDQLES